ncbi:hypothetical protein NUACC21_69090 [Scytonema sp. NUACC21]
MKFKYIVVPLATTGIVSVSAAYANTSYFLQFLKNPHGIVKILQHGQLEAKLPPNRGVPTTGRESGSSRSLK